MIDEEKSRSSNRLRDLAGGEHDDAAIDNMEKIVEAALIVLTFKVEIQRLIWSALTC